MGEFEKINRDTGAEWEPDFKIRFPPLPRTVSEVTKLLAESSEIPDTPKLVEIVNSDPVIGAFILRRINSAYYGMRSRVADIEKACFLLGFEEVCDIVLTAGMMKLADIFNTKSQIEIFDTIMEMSLGAAEYNKRLASHFQIPRRDFAFTVGLLHTLGRLVLLYNRPSDYEALWNTTDAGRPPSATSEQIIFGTDHGELSAQAGADWHLPEEAVTVIRHYETPGHISEQASRNLALSLSVAASATEHFFLIPQDQRAAEFQAPATLFALARVLEVKPEPMVAFIEESSDEVGRFISSMMGAGRR